ncbi:hypothetical protein BDI4_40017 [Burkholderia diffusa]|nr:hypothetical protein BDI4_40017 [Burkholderia diffusa]
MSTSRKAVQRGVGGSHRRHIRRVATGRATGVQQNRPRQGPVSFPFDPTRGQARFERRRELSGSHPDYHEDAKER